MPGLLDPKSFSNVQLEQFQTRLKARLFLIFIFVIQGSLRVERVAQSETNLFNSSDWILLITFAFILILITLIIVECVLFKKLGPRILKYTHIIDGIFFVFFTMEWMTTWYVTLVRFKDPGFKCLKLTSIIGFTSFAWRALLQNLIVKRWYIRCIAPIVAYASVLGFTINTMDHDSTMNMVKGITYIFYITFIYYFEDKVNWNLMLTSAKRDKWIKINEYILNNIPEKIAILDDKGEILYINDYLKTFIKQCNFSQDPKKMFKEVKHLQRQFDTMETGGACFTDKGLFEKHSSGSLLDHDQEKDTINDEHINCLENLIKSFQPPIGETSVQIDGRSLQIYRGKLRLEDKLEKSIEVKISRIIQDSKYYIVLILQDTTQRDLLVTLESNNRYKDYLLASVSHELRTPLNGTINLVDAALNTNQVPATVKEDLLLPALKSSKFLLHLINDILDMSMITAQKFRLAFQSRNLKETLLDCVQLVDLSAKKKNIELLVEFHSNLPEIFCTDHNRISQIVLNLLSNSIKFTQKGAIKLIAVAIEQSSYVRISIEDSGIGMSKDDISKLFQTYTHIDNEGKRNLNPTGVGLGLNIAYNLAGLLGPNGNKGITVDSTPNKGSVFTFLVTNQDMNHEPMPLLLHSSSPDDGEFNASDQLAIDIEPTLDQKMISRLSTKSMKRLTEYGLLSSSVLCECPKVLAIDDDPFNILAYESVMGALNVKLDTAYNGRLAIEKLLSRAGRTCSLDCKCYRAVFIDREMPGMSGCEAVKEIRSLEKQNKLPKMNIIGCTGHGGMKEVEEFMQSGIDQCIQKPIKKIIIKEVLERYGL